MTNVLTVIYSLPFIVGALAGAVGMRLYQRHQCKVADKLHPLPDGRRRAVPGISRTWMGYLLSAAVLGYVLLQVGQTEAHYRELGDEMRRCQLEFQSALVARSRITSENDELSREQRDLLGEAVSAQALWLSRIVDLPDNIAALAPDDPRVQQYGQTVTRIYRERTDGIRERVLEISDRQAELQKQRAENPLPEPTCGR